MLEVVVKSACTLLNSISSQFGANTNANSASDFTELHVLELLWSIGSWVRSQQRHVLEMFEMVVESTCSLLNSIHSEWRYNCNCQRDSNFTELQVLKVGHD